MSYGDDRNVVCPAFFQLESVAHRIDADPAALALAVGAVDNAQQRPVLRFLPG
jgi:hypothetical protein